VQRSTASKRRLGFMQLQRRLLQAVTLADGLQNLQAG